jgi:hypothetical protein
MILPWSPRQELFLHHILAAALERNRAGCPRTGAAGTSLRNLKFQTAGFAHVKITFFHVTAVCHSHTLLPVQYYAQINKTPDSCPYMKSCI